MYIVYSAYMIHNNILFDYELRIHFHSSASLEIVYAYAYIGITE